MSDRQKFILYLKGSNRLSMQKESEVDLGQLFIEKRVPLIPNICKRKRFTLQIDPKLVGGD